MFNHLYNFALASQANENMTLMGQHHKLCGLNLAIIVIIFIFDRFVLFGENFCVHKTVKKHI